MAKLPERFRKHVFGLKSACKTCRKLRAVCRYCLCCREHCNCPEPELSGGAKLRRFLDELDQAANVEAGRLARERGHKWSPTVEDVRDAIDAVASPTWERVFKEEEEEDEEDGPETD